MACRCDSNTAQYERNRSFGHLVHALGRAAGGAKLPSAGLCLNASKAEASLAESGKDTLTVEPRESGGSKQCDFTSRASHAVVRCDVEAHLDHGERCGVNLRNSNERTERFIVAPRRRCSRFDVAPVYIGVGTVRALRTRPRKACTSLLVMHRDPFDVGLSAAREPRRSKRRRDRGVRRPAVGRYSDREPRTRYKARPARRKATSSPSSPPKRGRWCGAPVVAAVPVSDCARLSLRCYKFRALAGPVLKHGPRSLACVRVIECIKTERHNESEGACAPRGRARSGRMERRSRSTSRTPEASRFQSVNAGAL
ncbi:hypothetical protein K1T71_012644 [Dendrolimus kikuchii]|uniref:Uncharacterized protein n=9 Tax=Dendrolimus kikuchii TaxID=765133 RepID=A0ACC1CJW1_9NEOP|nr:hypothetical protein K1T71_012621 [Dendrolimus kikuchii]KAJ0171861.1 hypothetical protein K1T71_012624 [Dendrolimus kikuchii]KAJ0171868.1 hypothetical protein K1T71_012631 [Dendrolimus kikuchii]KAJ0171871.1 hypothetical protein K1T71_012634 [Dendrolimus kikuchii]KAJ0171875.1 hypothetical protein K1T71_012638 [Dendrolimus kikuchii]